MMSATQPAMMQIAGYRYDRQLFMESAERVITALAVLLVTWLLAKLAKWAFAKLVDRVEFFRKGTSSGESVGQSLGKIVSLLIWLFGLIALLQLFGLSGVLQPVQILLNEAMGYVVNIAGAAIFFFVGSIIARIVRQIVETALQTLDFDGWASKGGVDAVTGEHRLSRTIGAVIYALILILVTIGALQALGISSISDPASDMLRKIFVAIPNIIVAAMILGIGMLIARWAGDMLREILPGLGIDRSIAALEIMPAGNAASTVISRVVQIGILLFFAIMATRTLDFPEITAILDQVLQLGGRVVFGGVIIAFGFLIASFLARIVAGTSDGGLAPAVVRYATLVLFSAMGLKFMGIADSIIELAFGALVVGAAAAGALAFGLGGREAAARKLAEIEEKLR